MRRRTFQLSMALLLATAACGPAEVVVTMEIEAPNPDGEGTVTRPLSDVEVALLPYDRDVVFDSMQTAFEMPEPQVPQELIEAREGVQEAQQRWQRLESRWGTLRDTLQTISETMAQYSRGEARYVALFREFGDLEEELNRVERQRDAAFEEFTELQQGIIRASDSIRILQDNWADEAFAGVGEIFLAKTRASGLDVAVDTTDANGVARTNLMVAPGQYWVHARYELPYTELYWNVPITVERGEPNTITLTEENAEERIKL